MILENVEGLAEWNIAPPHLRIPGIAAFVRLKDEADYIIPALQSIAWCDEIVIALQGEQSDGTDNIVRRWARGKKHVRILDYPFDSLPNGPGHDLQPRGSVHERAYFYNWTLAQTTRSHALKWDGDMVAMDWLASELAGGATDAVRFNGVEIARRAGLLMSQSHPRTATETRLFCVADRTFYVSGPYCERLVLQTHARTIEKPAYLHFKHAKPQSARAKAWPKNWRDLPHFQAIADRALPGRPWTGPVPEALNEAVGMAG